jgi:hypothetical protein
MPPVGFEPTISADEWPQIYALDRAASGTGCSSICSLIFQSPLVIKCTIHCNTKTCAFSAEFNFAIRKILKQGNGIPISVRPLNLLTYELDDKQIRGLKEAVDA